jgi:hypothetical protein
MAKQSPKAKEFIHEEMHKFKEGALHSGSKKGPKVSNPKQAIAISLSTARKKGMKVGGKKRG